MPSLFARIVNSTVEEVITVPDGVQLNQMFTPDLVAQCVACDGTVRQRWTYDGAFHSPAAPPKPLDPVDRTFDGGFTWS